MISIGLLIAAVALLAVSRFLWVLGRRDESAMLVYAAAACAFAAVVLEACPMPTTETPHD